MDIKELAKILGSSSGSSQYKYIPWWEGDFDEDRYRYSMFKGQEIQDAEACIAMCSGEELSDTSGNGGMSLFHQLYLLFSRDWTDRNRKNTITLA